MSNGIVFDRDSARRIANATRGYEQEQSAPESVNYQENGSYGRMMLVRTDSILPSGYTGLMAAPGSIIEKLPSGQINIISKVWIKDQNSGTLSANTIYQARLGGTYTQDITTNGITAPTTLGLYLVQGGSQTISLSSNSIISGKIVKQYGANSWTISHAVYDSSFSNGIIFIDFTLPNFIVPWTFSNAFNFIGTAIVTDPITKIAYVKTTQPFYNMGFVKLYSPTQPVWEVDGNKIVCSDPLGIMNTYGSGRTVLIMVPGVAGFNSYSNIIPTIIAGVGTAFTPGIGSGIGNGISGV